MIRAICIFLCLVTLRAESFFVAENQLGSGDGSTTNNAHSRAWFNTAGNWANPKVSGKVGPGDTVNFFGVLTNTIACSASGSSGNPITLQVLSTTTTPSVSVPAVFSAPTIGDGHYWVTFKDWIILDGGGNTNSITFTCTSNYSGGPFTNSCGGFFYGGGSPLHHVTMRNLGIRHLYDRHTASHTDTYPAVVGIYMIGSDVTYTNMTVGEAVTGIAHAWTASEITSNIFFLNSFTTNVDHGWEMGYGSGPSAFVLNVKLDKSALTLGDMYETEDGFDIGLHRNPIFFFNSNASGGYISNLVVSHCLIKAGSYPTTSTAGTAGIFQDLASDQEKNVQIFDNIFLTVIPLKYSGGDGYFGAAGPNAVLAYNTALSITTNNAVVSTNSAGQMSLTGGSGYIYGNIIGSANQGIRMYITDLTIPDGASDTRISQAYTNYWSDYNVLIASGFPSYDMWAANGSAVSTRWFSVSLGQWQVGGTGGRPADGGFLTPHLDPHSTTTFPTFDSNFFPTANTLSGTNLTAMGITDDFYGNPRPTNGVWLVGALQTDPTGGGGGGGTTGGGGGTTGGGASSGVAYPQAIGPVRLLGPIILTH